MEPQCHPKDVEKATSLISYKFEPKVGSRKTTKIGNLVVLSIFLVAIILIPYNIQLFLSSQNDIFVKERLGIKLKEFVWMIIFKIFFSQNIW